MRQSLVSESVVRSSSLRSCLHHDEGACVPPEFDAEEFRSDWRDAFDSDEAFRDRLDRSGQTVENAVEQLEAASGNPSDSVPSAFETAEEVVDHTVECDVSAVESLRARHDEAPFVDLVAPLVVAAGEGLRFENDFGSSALESLEDWLFERLVKVLRHPLFILFKAYQRTEYPETDFGGRTDSTEVYDEFVAAHRDYEPLFEQYPVALKLLGTVVEQWRGALCRLDERLSADRDALARTFGDGDDLGRIVDVEPLSDDPHGEGEVVFGVRFGENRRVVYKPRSVGAEAAFGELLDWVNARADVPDLYAPTVLDRREYGWMEFLPHRACDSPEAVERYYERMGGLSALGFVLGSTDLHHENVVAAGENPVVVDLETALVPEFEQSGAASDEISSLLEGSIFDTLLVPFAKRTEAGDSELTTSGLSELTGEERASKRPNFRQPNTDAMELTFDRTFSFDGRNLPRLDGEPRPVGDYLDELKRGFRAVARTILANRDDFRSTSGPLAAFEGTDVRYLLRPTGEYATTLARLRYASQLRSGLRQSLALEALYDRFVPQGDEKPRDDEEMQGDGEMQDDEEMQSDEGAWNLVPTEKDALRRLTIPRFTVAADGRELKDGRGNRLGVFVDESPIERARRRIEALDDHRIETQLRLVDLALTDSMVADTVSAPSDDRARSIPDPDSPRAVVSNVVSLLDERAATSPDGGLRWAEPARSSPTDHLLVHEPGPDLYEGYAGVGLFLAAVAAVRGDDELADRSRSAFESARRALENAADAVGIGGMAGKGSVAYGLLTAGELLDDADLVERARAVARRTTEEEIAADTDLDVVSGSAGELLAQVAVFERTGDDRALERARRCGDRLLEATRETPAGYRVPTSEAGDRRFAFAHGAGGVGYALVKLAAVTGDDEYAEVGRDALRFDLELWRRARDGRRVADTGDEPSGATDGPDTIWGWCNGVAGVGTGRVAAADSTAVERVGDFSVVRNALRTEPSAEDSLCCGSAGRALFALDASDAFGDSALADHGKELFEATLARADREGRLRLANHLPTFPKFGLFTGLTGVGYVALTVEAHEEGVSLPNVARLE